MSDSIDRALDRWGDEIGRPRLKGKLSYEDSIRHLINLCLTCDDYALPEYVERLLYALPTAWRDDEFEEELEPCTYTVHDWHFTYNCGVRCGTIEKPLLDIDGRVISPIPIEYDETNWKQVLNAIINLCDRRELLLSKDRTELITDADR